MDEEKESVKKQLLVILTEECAELSICATKYLRFGQGSTFLKKNPIELEVGDVLAAISCLVAMGAIDMEKVSSYQQAKIKRLEEILKP